MSVAHFYLTLVVLNFQKVEWFGGAFLTAQSSFFFCFRVVFRNMAACALKFPGSVPLPNLNLHFLLPSRLLSLSYSVLNPPSSLYSVCHQSRERALVLSRIHSGLPPRKRWLSAFLPNFIFVSAAYSWPWWEYLQNQKIRKIYKLYF